MFTIYSALTVYENPDTKEYASMFVHNIKHIIVTNGMIISCNGTKASELLKSMGFTIEISHLSY